METVRIDGERLVQAVVGALRYLPAALWLDSLRSLIRQHNPAVTVDLSAGGEPEVRLWPTYEVPLRWLGGMGRLPTRRGGDVPLRNIAPEAAIENDKWLLFLNCTSAEEADGETVFQDYAIARRIAGDKDFLVLHVNAAWTRRIMAGVAMISPVGNERDVSPQDSLARYIAMRHLRLGSSNKTTVAEVEKHLAWLSWQSIFRLLDRIDFETIKAPKGSAPTLLAPLRRLRDDAMELLERGDLAPTDHGLVQHLARLNIDPAAIPELPGLAEETRPNRPAAGVPLPPPKRPGVVSGAAAPPPGPGRGRPAPPPARPAPPAGRPAPVAGRPAPVPRPAPAPAPPRPAVPELPPIEPPKVGPPAAAPPVTTRRTARRRPVVGHEEEPQGGNGQHPGSLAEPEEVPASEPPATAAPAPAQQPAPAPPAQVEADEEGWFTPDDLGTPEVAEPPAPQRPPEPRADESEERLGSLGHRTLFRQAGDEEAVAGVLPGARPRPARAAALLAAGLGVGGPRDDWKGIAGFLVKTKIDPDLIPPGLRAAERGGYYDEQ